MNIEVFGFDQKTGISWGINADGDLFIGDTASGANLPDTPENRERILRDFIRYTK